MPWNIDRIYESYDSPLYRSDWNKLGDLIENARIWVENLPQRKDSLACMEEFIKADEQINWISSRLFSYSSLQLSSQVQNEEARRHLEKLQMKMEILTVPHVRFSRWIKDQDLTAVKDSPTLAPFLWNLQEIKTEAMHLLPEREEELLTKLKKTGSGAWAKLQQSITSLATGTIIGENGVEQKMPLMSIRNLAFHEDPKMRKKAFDGENKIYETLEEPAGAAINQIKGEMLTETKWRGYNTPWEAISHRHRISQTTVFSVMSAVKSKLPILQTFYQTKAKFLGYTGGLPYWDLYAPLGKITTSYPFEEAKKVILEVFGTFDPVMKDMAARSFQEDWIDIEPRIGKRGGAFCSGIYSLQESRILLNHENTLENLITLAHELGHAYHNIWLMKKSILCSGSPLSLAETASTFNEHLVQDYIAGQLTGHELLAFLEKKIQRSITVIVDIYSRFIFEQRLMELREENTIPVRKIKEMMVSAEIEAYGEGLDKNFCQPNAWINKPHYYMPGLHFYNFPYTLGNLISTYLYHRFQTEGKGFLPLYQKLLGECGQGSVEEILGSVGIDLCSPDFIASSFAVIEKDLSKFQELLSHTQGQ